MANLRELAESHLAAARTDKHGRSALLIANDGPLRQTVIALREGIELAEHNSPPASSLQVLVGRVRVVVDDEPHGEFGEGELWILTHERHSVLALADSVFLLTTVTNQQGQDSYT
ncbi:cupin [Hoyosella sp. G463]|uniref:Cupin n=1 Tax=Lolliginicoccus lacisalsi TaxID=2742202 RepID=A0A927JB09_9ACTN|nr:cupin [Lolliginicoccus lacisalsi]MBD8505122.1 cupin [Lolliginicoccus lacisalsi]